MEKSVQITLIIVAGFVLLGFLGFIALQGLNPNQNTVTGEGLANIKAVPDLVGVYFNVQTRGTTSEEATTKNSEIVDDLITELVKQGFERKDIQTLNFNVYPEYNRNGYSVTHQIKVGLSTDRADKIGDVIDAGVEAGAGISYINFELSQEKQNEYKAQALKLAAEDAKLKAQAIAEGLGKKVGNLVSTSSSDFNYYPWAVYSSSGRAEDATLAKEATTNIQPSEQEISARVIAIFKLR